MFENLVHQTSTFNLPSLFRVIVIGRGNLKKQSYLNHDHFQWWFQSDHDHKKSEKNHDFQSNDGWSSIPCFKWGKDTFNKIEVNTDQLKWLFKYAQWMAQTISLHLWHHSCGDCYVTAIEIHPEITAHKISHDFIKLLVSLEITPNPVNKVTKSSLILSNEFLQRTSLTLITSGA